MLSQSIVFCQIYVPQLVWSEGIPKLFLTQASNKSSAPNLKGGGTPQTIVSHQVELREIEKS